MSRFHKFFLTSQTHHTHTHTLHYTTHIHSHTRAHTLTHYTLTHYTPTHYTHTHREIFKYAYQSVVSILACLNRSKGKSLGKNHERRSGDKRPVRSDRVHARTQPAIRFEKGTETVTVHPVTCAVMPICWLGRFLRSPFSPSFFVVHLVSLSVSLFVDLFARYTPGTMDKLGKRYERKVWRPRWGGPTRCERAHGPEKECYCEDRRRCFFFSPFFFVNFFFCFPSFICWTMLVLGTSRCTRGKGSRCITLRMVCRLVGQSSSFFFQMNL